MGDGPPATKRPRISAAETQPLPKENSEIGGVAMAENEVKERETVCKDIGEASDSNKVPAFLCPANSSSLINIINQLDPSTFVKLARTCRAMNEICFNSRGIEIIHSDLRATVGFKRTDSNELPVEFWKGSEYFSVDFLNSAENRRRVRDKYPFVFHCQALSISIIPDENVISNIRDTFEDLNVQRICEFSTYIPNEWNGFLRLLEDFHVESLTATRDARPIPPGVVKHLLTSKLKKFCYRPYGMLRYMPPDVRDDMILEATVPNLSLYRWTLSEALFMTLIAKCSNSTDDIQWEFKRRNRPMFTILQRSLFKTFSHDYLGPIPVERPLLFVGRRSDREFWILRKDGKVVHCFDDEDESVCRFIMVEDPGSLPACLR